MSFATPLVLVGLVLVPLALLVYVAFQRRRDAYAVRFTNLDLLAAVAPRTPGWRRHLPPALLVLALAALVLALARPQAVVSVPKERAAVMLVTDSSGSMQARDVEPNRLIAARKAAETFIEGIPEKVRVGAVAFSSRAEVLSRPTTDRPAVLEALAGLTPEGGTATGSALDAALDAVDPTAAGGRPPARGKGNPAAIVLLSDGKATTGSDPLAVAQRARDLRIPVYTVALGTPDGVIDLPDPQTGQPTRLAVPPDPEALREIARTSGGRFFNAPDAGDLEAVYADLGSRIGSVREKREVTAAFAGGALILVLAAAGLSLVWFGRFP